MNNLSTVRDLWAKSAEDGKNGETLLKHTELVVSALANIAMLYPNLHMQVDMPRLWHRVFWACCLHDLGKVATGFQLQLRTNKRWGYRHEVLSLAFLDWLPCDQSDKEWIAAAIVSHHKDSNELEEKYPVDMENDDFILNELTAQIPGNLLDSLASELNGVVENWRLNFRFDTLGVDHQSIVHSDNIIFCQSATETICRYIKRFYLLDRSLQKSKHINSEVIASILIRGIITTADHMASAHEAPPHLTLKGVDQFLQLLGLPWETLYEHQRACANIKGSAILTAPTGSGKTESALLWAAKQKELSIGSSRIFYVLPFQASMNAMKKRLEEIFPGEVGLDHGRSLYALYRAYTQIEGSPKEATKKAYYSRNLSRLHAYPIRVLSPYQLLKSCYRLRGYEASLTDCFGGRFIFDEMHAYEPARLAMIIGMMRYLREYLQAQFCIMTATMPPQIIPYIKEALGELEEITASSKDVKRFSRHRLKLIDDEITSEASLRVISDAALSGKSVLVCCNTVRRAQDVYIALKNILKNITIDLLHSRFTIGDRLNKEGMWLKDASKPTQAKGVLISTQVVEVSLNLDFDTIFTDPAPLEALLQRFGRVNRTARSSPVPVHVYLKPTDGQYVYNPLIVQRTLEVIKPENNEIIDESKISIWLEQIYYGKILKYWVKEYKESAYEFEATCIQTLYAFNSDDSLETAFYKAFDNIDILPICFESIYNLLSENDPLRATEYLVGVSWRQYAQLKEAGLVICLDHHGHPPVIDVPYSTEVGLRLDSL